MVKKEKPPGFWTTVYCKKCGGGFIAQRLSRCRTVCDACYLPRMWGDVEGDGRQLARAIIDVYKEE
jgi:hypothetical protein